ncbi:SDR family NAD(P)-dependent oxidoreductase [Alcanivorax sp. IL3]|jgi:NAD(P)-dependent dehydrogenase (short-subunit alcohol dehydrogenase family)|uniref:SDR family NAD(P)-dependent oxidoreductase n=1 Tax=Alcanivorax TaxID=59753 RepID=UPI000C48C4FA|nr:MULTISPECIES: SDR family NAD(P)-dependent oxidoreductase [Alcanivorax]MAC13822.1 3-oxoacyl-ACP reductase [Alcanivorax sp.]MBG33764.1 3-oxoacyl-ACP reductase [Alcanivorax sp.]MDF1636212.1 SDR family NAD(P)-dependent oxidoreductase [Alcanivorax jadensis]|tara:strand:- start:1727 stop:2497 length:771 start_codon:yes stop_codon:yes gene_type:complete
MDPILDFTGKTALITGAASGFGKLLAEELGKRGAALVLGDINMDALNTQAEALADQGVKVAALRCDVSSEADCKAMVETALAQFGHLDMAVNNAGIAHGFIPFDQLTEEVLDQQVNVNVKGVMFGMKHQIAAMKEKGGSIVNVSSMAGLGGAPKIGAYSAAKHAVIGLTKTAAVEVAKRNIRVNAICPFYTHTPMVDEGNLSEDKAAMHAMLASGCPMKRLGQPEEIVTVMLMMLSPANSYMNGQAIAVDGGVSAF